mgnify:CR=1 FL=1
MFCNGNHFSKEYCDDFSYKIRRLINYCKRESSVLPSPTFKYYPWYLTATSFATFFNTSVKESSNLPAFKASIVDF